MEQKLNKSSWSFNSSVYQHPNPTAHNTRLQIYLSLSSLVLELMTFTRELHWIQLLDIVLDVSSLDADGDENNGDQQLRDHTKTYFDGLWRQEARCRVWDLELQESDCVGET